MACGPSGPPVHRGPWTGEQRELIGFSLRQHGKDEELTGNLTSGEFGWQSGSVGWAARLDGASTWSLMGAWFGAEEENDLENGHGGRWGASRHFLWSSRGREGGAWEVTGRRW
jgi:hypothetical protein